MNEKIKAQICFAGTANLEKVKEQLVQLKNENKYEFHCCFLPRHIVVEKGFTTDIIDMLENTLGDDLIWELKEYKSFDDIMKDLYTVREHVANTVNRMFVLDSGTARGVAKEIELFTSAKVIMMP